ncbi:hypothetical protein TNCV_4512661 [Trichonephila clavipes]|nr:hypothetical protein TNCV_4512661 [Trichonephila clavipes]
MILHVGYRSFSWIFSGIKPLSRQISWRLQFEPTHLRIVSPDQSNCDATTQLQTGSTVLSWSIHTQQVCVRKNVWQQFFGRSAFLRQQKLICHLLSCGAPVLLLIERYICFLQASYFYTTSPVPSTTHFKNDFYSLETTL